MFEQVSPELQHSRDYCRLNYLKDLTARPRNRFAVASNRFAVAGGALRGRNEGGARAKAGPVCGCRLQGPHLCLWAVELAPARGGSRRAGGRARAGCRLLLPEGGLPGGHGEGVEEEEAEGAHGRGGRQRPVRAESVQGEGDQRDMGRPVCAQCSRTSLSPLPTLPLVLAAGTPIFARWGRGRGAKCSARCAPSTSCSATL
jgi:hypothetical protein